jgi:hypothetical protein
MMIVALCLFAAVGFGLGLIVRWPILAIVSVIGLFGGFGILISGGHGWLAALGWPILMVILLEIGYLLASLGVSQNLVGALSGAAHGSAQKTVLADTSSSPAEFSSHPLLGGVQSGASDEGRAS